MECSVFGVALPLQERQPQSTITSHCHGAAVTSLRTCDSHAADATNCEVMRCLGRSAMSTIRLALQEIKDEILDKFVALLMSELQGQGFTFADVLEALARWSPEQIPDEYVRSLEEIAESVREVGQ